VVRVSLETKIGDVSTRLDGRLRGWLGKKFTSLLDGRHTLDVRVKIGEVRIKGGRGSRAETV
jgi:hypothetical protein